MAFSSLFTLIDDIASILDDVALMTKKGHLPIVNYPLFGQSPKDR